MAARVRQVRARDLARVLEALGFVRVRQKGSHAFFLHADGRATVVPLHGGEDIGRGLLRRILRDIEVSPDSLIDLLK